MCAGPLCRAGAQWPGVGAVDRPALPPSPEDSTRLQAEGGWEAGGDHLKWVGGTAFTRGENPGRGMKDASPLSRRRRERPWELCQERAARADLRRRLGF